MKTAKYFFTSLLIAAIMVGLAFIFGQFLLPQYSFLSMGTAVVVGMFMGTVGYWFVSRSLKKDTRKFMGALAAGMGVKMLLGLVSVLVVVLIDRRIIYEYVVVLLIAYLVFTSFEVYSLNRNLRAENSESTEVAKE